MFLLSTPSDERVRALLAHAADAPFTYPCEGMTKAELDEAPTGYRLHRYGAVIGEGAGVFATACEALCSFANYPASFTRVVRLEPEFAVGTVFGTVASHFGFASVHPCRISFVIDEPELNRFGFGLGTLPGHAGCGEERFLVQLDEETGRVRYDVQAVSKPNGFWMSIGEPIMRFVQRRFQQGTCEAMASFCNPSKDS